MSLYVPFRAQVRKIIDKHFPPELSRRFTLRSDSEIWIPREDEGVWLRKKHSVEALHILFDGFEIFEIPQDLEPKYAEVHFLKAFKQALKDDKINIHKKKEWSDNVTAKRNRKEKQKRKKKKIEASYKYAHANPEYVEKVTNLPNVGKKKILKLK